MISDFKPDNFNTNMEAIGFKNVTVENFTTAVTSSVEGGRVYYTDKGFEKLTNEQAAKIKNAVAVPFETLRNIAQKTGMNTQEISHGISRMESIFPIEVSPKSTEKTGKSGERINKGVTFAKEVQDKVSRLAETKQRSHGKKEAQDPQRTLEEIEGVIAEVKMYQPGDLESLRPRTLKTFKDRVIQSMNKLLSPELKSLTNLAVDIREEDGTINLSNLREHIDTMKTFQEKASKSEKVNPESQEREKVIGNLEGLYEKLSLLEVRYKN